VAKVLSLSARMHGDPPPSSVVGGSNWISRRMLMAMPRSTRKLLIFLLPYGMLVGLPNDGFLIFGAGQRDLDFATEVVQVNRVGFVSCRTRVGFVVEQVNRGGFVSCRTCLHLEVDQVNRRGFVSCRTRVGFVVEQVNRWGFVSCRTCLHLEVDQVNRRGFVSCRTHADFGVEQGVTVVHAV
jgi:hypothetical protein